MLFALRFLRCFSRANSQIFNVHFLSWYAVSAADSPWVLSFNWFIDEQQKIKAEFYALSNLIFIRCACSSLFLSSNMLLFRPIVRRLWFTLIFIRFCACRLILQQPRLNLQSSSSLKVCSGLYALCSSRMAINFLLNGIEYARVGLIGDSATFYTFVVAIHHGPSD